MNKVECFLRLVMIEKRAEDANKMIDKIEAKYPPGTNPHEMNDDDRKTLFDIVITAERDSKELVVLQKMIDKEI